jgi:hypothetical protein
MLDMEAYQTYKHKDRAARILMLTNMRNDIMLCFERHHLAQFVWDTVKIQYGETFTIRLCQLTLKFNSYKKRQNQTMRQHLTVMANVISELRGAGHEMTDEQQVQTVIRFCQAIGNTYVLTLPTMTTLRYLMMLLIVSNLKKIGFTLRNM